MAHSTFNVPVRIKPVFNRIREGKCGIKQPSGSRRRPGRRTGVATHIGRPVEERDLDVHLIGLRYRSSTLSGSSTLLVRCVGRQKLDDACDRVCSTCTQSVVSGGSGFERVSTHRCADSSSRRWSASQEESTHHLACSTVARRRYDLHRSVSAL